jgi:hypothetical protein
MSGVSPASLPTPPSIRGPLRYDVVTSSPRLEAGSSFSVFVTVTNPYDVPVTIENVSTRLPVEFKDPADPRENDSVWGAVKKTFREELEQESRRVSYAQSVSGGEEKAASASQSILLQPGNSAVQAFTLKTKRTLLFTPSTYVLQIETVYRMDGETNHDAIRYQMNVQAPLKSVISGAVFGAIMGGVVRAILGHPSPTNPFAGLTGGEVAWQVVFFLASMLSSILIASIVVVAFARKREAQPIFSIEDFWGGMFVGFAAGYGGEKMLEYVFKDVPPPAVTP